MLSTFFKNNSYAEFKAALKTQRGVIFAFYIKELRARFGEYNLGLLWALLEPIAHVGVFTVIFSMKANQNFGMAYPIFVMLGILPWLLFKNIIRRSVTAISANKAMFNYPGVRPLDTILARAFLEINISIFVTASLCLIFYLLGFDIFFKNFVGYIEAIILIIIMALGFGIICAVLDAYYSSTQRFLNIIFRFLYFMSGIFYPILVVPEPYRTYFLYNPILQAILLVRHGHTPSYGEELTKPEYLAVFAIATLAIGLFYYSLHWKKIIERQ
jgi:capsular polysaccharide transport system permease protein